MKKLNALWTIALILVLTLLVSACSGAIQLTSPSVVLPTGDQTSQDKIKAEDYAGLLTLIEKAKMSESPFSRRYYTMMKGGAPTAEDSNAAGRDASQDYSKTNIQVEGVDEADIIKTDGRYLFLVANNRLYVIDAADPAGMKVLSVQPFSAYEETDKTVINEYPVDMFLDVVNDRLILFVSGSISEKIEPVPEETEPKETVPEETKPDASQPEETKPEETGSDTTPPDASGQDGTQTETANPDGVVSSDGSTSAGQSGSSSGDEASSPPSTGADADLANEDAPAKMLVDRMWYPYYNTRSYTTTRIYDISNRAEPALVRQFTQDGYYMTSRKIGTAVYVVTNRYDYRIYEITAKDTDLADYFPSVCDVPGEDSWEALPPDRITILPDGDIGNQLILSGIDIADATVKPDVLSVLGSSGSVYASTQFLYVAAWNYQWDGKETSTPTYSTDLFRFKLDQAQVREAGKGSVPGSIINQFSMDEYNGYFRIATTTGEAWTGSENPSQNNLYVLDGSMNIVGQVTGLAKGEQIKSVRFMGDQAYVVTFRTVDPLFVIDLSDPANPVVKGELKIPGYSTYLHPYDENLLLGFGYDVMAEGDNAFNLGLKVSLFDVSDFSNPREVSTLLLGGTGSWADILYNHKSLLFSKEKNVIAFPAMLTKTDEKNPRNYTQPVFQGLLILGLDEAGQLVLRGSVTHFDKLSDPFGAIQPLSDKEMNAFYSYDAIYRSAWIGDTLFTFSGRQVRAASMNGFASLGQIELPGFDTYYTQGDVVYR